MASEGNLKFLYAAGGWEEVSDARERPRCGVGSLCGVQSEPSSAVFLHLPMAPIVDIDTNAQRNQISPNPQVA